MVTDRAGRPWPDLPYQAWRDTLETMQLWTQVVGKIRLSLSPWVNHGWQVPLYVTARGLGTSPIPVPGGILEIDFDFCSHRLLVRTSAGDEASFHLQPMTVADFHACLVRLLDELGVAVAIDQLPNEVKDPVRFSDDRSHASYDAAAAERFWRTLVAIAPVFTHFRSGYLGKVSPVHFFWGSFDLAVTRFSGRRAPMHPAGVPGLPDDVVREAYSHEVSSAGFWPGDVSYPHAAFYSYAYPEPALFSAAPVPAEAAYDSGKGEFLLPYEAVRAAADPAGLLLEFLQATYAAAADAGGWDRAALECALGEPGVVRRGP